MVNKGVDVVSGWGSLWRLMRVKDIMTSNPLTVTVDSPVADAVRIMRERSIRHLPVLDNGHLAGIITDRDLRWLLGQNLGGGERGSALELAGPVGEVMSSQPVTVSEHDSVLKAVDLMVERRFGGMPVLNAQEKLVGIVTYVDVLRACRELLRNA